MPIPSLSIRSPSPRRLPALLAGLLLAAGPAALAPPAEAATLLLDRGAPPEVVEVRGGCGFGEHRGFYGGCRINHGPRGRIRAFATGLPRGCPPGLRRGYYGRCV